MDNRQVTIINLVDVLLERIEAHKEREHRIAKALGNKSNQAVFLRAEIQRLSRMVIHLQEDVYNRREE